MVDLQGHIERVTFINEENGYTVARVKVPGRREPVTVVGGMMNPMPGEKVRMKGEWTNHPRFGEQFRIVFCESSVPATVYGIEKYLGSGLIKGIGPVMARRMVERFGEATLEIIESESSRLLEVEGIGEKRVAMILKAWEEQREIRAIMLFLQSHGVSASYASRIFRQYGNAAVKVLQENPYRLATDIFGVGFLTADRIAEKMGFARDSRLRAEAGILFVLHELADEGHVLYPAELLIRKCQEILEIDPEIIAAALEAAAGERRIVIEEGLAFPEAQPELIRDRAVYLAKYHLSETQAAARLKTLLTTPSALRPIDGEKTLVWVQEKLSLRLADNQIEAIRAAVSNKVLVITGGPGTGKTTIINAILRIFSASGAKILLAAPTGRATKRMSEATGREAKTIHRLLEYSPQKGGFQKDETSPLDCQVLIVDEASMIDVILMHHLLKAIPASATFILVGDGDQLPSVGAGSVLTDVMKSRRIPVVELREIFRQARESSIVLNAHRINRGEIPRLLSTQDGLDDFYFVEQEDPEKVLELIVRLVTERIPQRFGLDPLEDIQVLTPMHRGLVGAGNLNSVLQKALNPGEEGLQRGGRFYRVGDKVMQIRNNYDREVYNGDIGRIVRLDSELQEATLTFDGREVVYDYGDLEEIVLSYAVSVHKSQGAEYPAVVLPLLMQHYLLLQRNLLYTAVTRGKKLVVIVGTKKALAIAVRNDKTRQRFSLLSQRLRMP
ncbi:exodeoxyribonuclease V alpha subunit [Syntrophus gentianae]|uniref:Exodeoxyribonuclease V alpha subunit n=1 Tax=Syntrophus gentianae TaxID=43775 RepID=A0A1H7WPR7_9BACT|nr:ATP-dependent RecD-like DNA helicase [Syntrophus gentianae]SEM22999.1 exodeoxyribonuclease V alpha subunit [Syntrophus gentianae]